MREQFVDKRFNADHLKIIDEANAIIAAYRAQGFTLTLRQLYYQFVARGFLGNTQQNYKRLGTIINDGRLAGLIDWAAIEDRTRNVRTHSQWDDPPHIISACAEQFAIDLWEGQPHRVEVWVEKDALIGVIEKACTDLQVPYFACRGYTSQSEQYAAGKRIAGLVDQGYNVTILHLGDHDPSGIDMSRDNADRLAMFIGGETGWELKRIALTMAQIDDKNPPPNPAKVTDSRFADYQRVYGDDSWELDALDPAYIDQLIRAEIDALRDPDLWGERVNLQDQMQAQLRDVAEQWDDLIEHLL